MRRPSPAQGRSGPAATVRPDPLCAEPMSGYRQREGLGRIGARMSPYWRCQIAGWSAMGLLAATIPSLYGGLRWAVVGRAVVGATLGLVLTHELRRHMRRHRWLRMPIGQLVPRVAAAGLLVATTMVLAVLPFLLVII